VFVSPWWKPLSFMAWRWDKNYLSLYFSLFPQLGERVILNEKERFGGIFKIPV